LLQDFMPSQISQMKEVERAVPGAMGSPNAQSASFIQTGLTRLTGLREEPQIDDKGRDGDPSPSDLSAGESHGHRGTGVPTSETEEGHSHILKNVRMSDEGIDGCSRTRERLDEKTLDPDQNLTISATEFGSLLRRAPHADIRPPRESRFILFWKWIEGGVNFRDRLRRMEKPEKKIQSTLVDVFAELADLFGNPRSHGQVFGLLFSSTAPLPQEDIAEKLKIPAIQGSRDKAESVRKLATAEGFNLANTLFVGNDINDLPAIRVCGCSACPSDAHTSVKVAVSHALETPGGHGVTREICEKLLKLDAEWKPSWQHGCKHHDVRMRTTLTLNPDIAAKARRAVSQTGLPFKDVVNQALRAGLDEVLAPKASRKYRTKPIPMGLKPGISYDNISELLAISEGEKHRWFFRMPISCFMRRTLSRSITKQHADGGMMSWVAAT